MDHKEFSRKGGKAKSAAKTRAARRNAKKSRGRWATAVSYEVETIIGEKTLKVRGVLLLPGKLPFTLDKTYEKIISEIEQERGFNVKQLLDCSTISRLIK